MKLYVFDNNIIEKKYSNAVYTVKTMPCDNMLLHRAYAYAKKGDVLVVNCSNFYEAGYWGDLMSLGAKTKGIAGLVIDGCVRDADDIEAMGFPVFSRGLRTARLLSKGLVFIPY